MKVLKKHFAKTKLNSLNVKDIDKKAKELNFNFIKPSGKTSTSKSEKIEQLINGVNINQLNKKLQPSWLIRNLETYKLLGILIAVIAMVLAFSYQFNSCKPSNIAGKIKSKIDSPICYMEDANEKLNILIIPFNSIGEKEPRKDLGEVLDKRLLRTKDTFNINTFYCDQITISSRFDRDSAIWLLRQTNADLIIYGNYFDGGCITGKDSVCYNWLLSDNFNLGEDQENTNNYDFRLTSIRNLFDGHLQEKTDYIIQYLALLSYLKTNSYQKAIPVLEKLILNDEYNFNLELTLAQIYYMMGQNEKALTSFDSYMNKMTFKIKSDSIYLNNDKNGIYKIWAMSGMPRGMILRQMGKTQEAINSISRSLELTEAYYLKNPQDSALFPMLIAGYASLDKSVDYLKNNNQKLQLKSHFYKKAKTIFEAKKGEFSQSKHLIKTLFSFGNLEKNHKQYKVSKKIYESGIEKINVLDSDDFLMKAKFYNELADLHTRYLKDCKSGIKYSKASIENLEKFSKSPNPILADYHNGLATAYSFCNQPIKSQKAIDDAIQILEENPEVWDERNINYKLAIYYNNKAETLVKRGKLRNAQEYNLKAVNIYESLNNVDRDLVIVYNTGKIIENKLMNFKKMNEFDFKIKNIMKKYSQYSY